MTTQLHPPSETPRTDKEAKTFLSQQTVPADFARTLEKELSEAKENTEWWKKRSEEIDAAGVAYFKELTSLRSVAEKMAGALKGSLGYYGGLVNRPETRAIESALTAYQAIGKEKE